MRKITRLMDNKMCVIIQEIAFKYANIKYDFANFRNYRKQTANNLKMQRSEYLNT